jgi:hypothetical protein
MRQKGDTAELAGEPNCKSDGEGRHQAWKSSISLHEALCGLRGLYGPGTPANGLKNGPSVSVSWVCMSNCLIRQDFGSAAMDTGSRERSRVSLEALGSGRFWKS